jgi:integrase
VARNTDAARRLPMISMVVWSYQERLGHSTIAMTLDIYRHLFPRHDDSEELAAAERALLG